MKFGQFHLFSVPPWTDSNSMIPDEIAQIVKADELGYDEAWLAEHNARRYGVVGNCHLSAAAVATVTKQIRIGTAVTRLPLHHPLHIAEDLGFVDVLSKGRLDWGVGKGYDPLEFATYGVPFEEREERWEDAFNAVRHIWKTGRLEYSGKYNQIPDGELFPPPYQKPEPPIFRMVSRSDSSVVWAAERLFPMVIGQGPEWDDAKHKMELYADTADKAGHARDDIQRALDNCWQLKQMHLAESDDVAAKQYRDALMWYFDIRDNRTMFGFSREPQPYEYYLQHRSVLVGSPGRILEDLQEYSEFTGIKNVICWFNCGGQPQQQVMEAMTGFASEVMPRLRGETEREPAAAAT
jgi:alkanesulfonate monooxygenase SsuD/methylene tetrahydromethanopterin reductase-like flavin-dependent oxidoreductase (luciferase family)